ncbi:TRAFs-binding domain-containing protein [Longimicrobium sp.]|uniref:TRAFs-binding domain-containing protein n=1 Tax=Longimicrobium sp. TaxID=2029185 RepID=UPI003B3A739A
MSGPLCFVLMPFGKKADSAGVTIDFDAVYRDLIAPAVRDAGLEPLRADEEVAGGIIHKPMFERLVLCEYAVADLTTANANVFYELGVRHGVKPASTVLMFGGTARLPFDVALLRALPYSIGADGLPDRVEDAKAGLTRLLRAAYESKAKDKDSPLFQLLEDYPDIAHDKTDVFRDQVRIAESIKERLAAARSQGIDAVRAMEQELTPLKDQDTGVVIDLFLSYRSVKGWNEMVGLVERMPDPVSETVMVQEQLALALNRAGRGDEAERVLTKLIERKGPSSETYGILGRVYKDRWEAAVNAGETFAARGLLDKAIGAYLKGFEADWRDAYPGVNAVTLMEVREPPDPRREEVLPVVRYAVKRRVAGGKPNYWDHATLLELAVLAGDEAGASEALGNALAAVREPWEPDTTARNLRLIAAARERRGATLSWTAELLKELEKRAAK